MKKILFASLFGVTSLLASVSFAKTCDLKKSEERFRNFVHRVAADLNAEEVRFTEFSILDNEVALESASFVSDQGITYQGVLSVDLKTCRDHLDGVRYVIPIPVQK